MSIVSDRFVTYTVFHSPETNPFQGRPFDPRLMDAAPNQTRKTPPHMAQQHDPPPPKPKKPCSEAQLNANRANAQKSTGPRTPAGKLRSSLNNYQHGRRARSLLIPGESGEQRQLLADTFVDHLGAATGPEMFQAQSAADLAGLYQRALVAN